MPSKLSPALTRSTDHAARKGYRMQNTKSLNVYKKVVLKSLSSTLLFFQRVEQQHEKKKKTLQIVYFVNRQIKGKHEYLMTD